MFDLLQARDAAVQPAMLQLVLATLNVGLLCAILVIWLRDYRRMRTSFGLGLLLFAGALLLQSVMGILQLLYRGTGGLFLFVTLPEIFMFLALLLLLYLITK